MKDAIGEIDYAVNDATQIKIIKITVVAMIILLVLHSVKALGAM